MKTVNFFLGLVAVMVAPAPRLIHGAELKPETLQAWNQYVRSADSRMGERLDPGHQFLWTDESPDRSARLRLGEILVEPMARSGTRRAPDGLIHHWVGALFIPDATLESVLDVAHDYDHYKDIYRPKVVDSKLLTGTWSSIAKRFALSLRGFMKSSRIVSPGCMGDSFAGFLVIVSFQW